MESPQPSSAIPDLNGYDEYPEICDGGIDYLTEKNLIEKYLSETPHYKD
jgi:hypothetical protein